jgi:hypothetical protein
MPGDPQECRKHAINCRQLAETATNETARRAFENLAATWERLASELESATLFLQAMDDIEPKASAPIGLNGPMP